MRALHELALLLVLSWTLPAHALLACAVGSTNLVFPGYNPFSLLPTDITGTITVSCTGTSGDVAGNVIQLSTGNSSVYTTRVMRSGSLELNYNLFTSPTLSTPWGDGNAGSATVTGAIFITNTSATNRYPVYGRIFPGQNLPAGTYSDTITITLSF